MVQVRWVPLLLSVACATPAVLVPPDSRPADGPGAYQVGATTREIVDERGVTLTIEVWYPAVPGEGAVPEGYGPLSVVRDAYRDARPDLRGAPYPLVAFSHGYGGIRYQSTFLTERLASHGFVVVAPDHPHNTLFDLDADRTADVALARPGDLAGAVDGVLGLADDPLAGLADDDGYVVVGHSFGAWTSLVAGGGVLDLDASRAHCATDPTAGCDFIDLEGVTDVGDAVPDPRVRAIAALAPGGWFAFGEHGLDDVAAPLLVGGRLDEDLPYDSEIRPTYDEVGAPKALATLERTGHWAFTDLCEVGDFLPDCAGETSGYTDPALIRAWTDTLVVAHLRTELGLSDDAQWLSADAWTDPDVTFEVAR